MRHPPPLILGAGPAGSAAAIRLARHGIPAGWIDRQSAPGDALCGGFLSWATLDQIAALGRDPATLGGHPIDRLALFAGGRPVEAALPRPGMGLSRRALDTALQATARTAGARLTPGRGATALTPDRLAMDDGGAIAWTSLFLATGKHDLRGAARPRTARDPHIGLRLRLPPDPARTALLQNRIELHLFPGGYLGLLLQEDGSANACMAVHKHRLAASGGSPAQLFHDLADRSPALADRLAGMPADPVIDAIGAVPYGWRARETWPGLFRLGDQAAVIPSLAGEGIGMALAGAHAAVDLWLGAGRDGAARYQTAFAAAVARPLRMAGFLATLGNRPTLLRSLSVVPGAAALALRLTRF